MKSVLRNTLTAIWARRWRILIYFALLAVGFALERTGEHAEEGGTLSQMARATYQRISTFGYRKPDAGNTALVLLDDNPSSGHDPPDVAHNGCKRRLYLSKLVHALQVQGAAVIVLDFRFEAICPLEDKELSAAISGVAKVIPVIVGEDSRVVKTIKGVQPGSVGPGIDDLDLIPTPPQILPEPQGAKYGLITLAADTRRIPLRWAIAVPGSDPNRLTERRVQDSLSFAAATARMRKLFENPQLVDYLNRGVWPLTSFIPENKFPRQPGLDLLCKRQDSTRWAECKPQPDQMSIFRNNVAIVGFGENDRGPDMHDSILGNTPGVILQANYIEALLDRRFLRQSSWSLQVLLSFVCFAAIEIIFEFVPKAWAAPPLAILVVLVFYAISYVAMVQFGYYLDLWIPSALALALKAVSSLQTWAKENVLEKNRARQVVP